MTIPAAADVADNEDNGPAANAADAAVEHTPDLSPPAETAPPAAPDPSEPDSTALQATVSELAGIVTGLVSQVADLATAVAGLVPGDHAPKRKPWTHMGSGS